MAAATQIDHAMNLKTALDQAGENRNELELFIESAKKTHGDLGNEPQNFSLKECLQTTSKNLIPSF